MKKTPILFLVASVIMNLVGCSQKADQPPPTQAQAIKLTETIGPPLNRNENARIERRDEKGHLCELEIQYLHGDVGVRYFDERSKVSKVCLYIKRHELTAVGTPTPDGKSIAWFEAKNKTGVVVQRSQTVGPKTQRYSTFRDDGTLHFTNDESEDSPHIFRLYHPDGKTVMIETAVFSVRQWLKMYEPDGKLLYEEKAEENANPRDIVNFHGTVFNADGKPAMRFKCLEGPYSGWDSSILKVEVLNQDGSVKSTIDPERVGRSFDTYRDPILARITKIKAEAGKIRNNGGLRIQVVESDLTEIISD